LTGSKSPSSARSARPCRAPKRSIFQAPTLEPLLPSTSWARS
jgi:hypothetical protein